MARRPAVEQPDLIDIHPFPGDNHDTQDLSLDKLYWRHFLRRLVFRAGCTRPLPHQRGAQGERDQVMVLVVACPASRLGPMRHGGARESVDDEGV